MNKIKVTIQSSWHDSAEIASIKRMWKKQYKDVKSSFTDGGDYYSSWTFDGPVDQVEDILRNNWELNSDLDFKDALEELTDECDIEFKFY